jgi:hypothetical protein
MKKILMLLIVAVLMLGISGQAMANFDQGDLIRVVYSAAGSGNEVATDLGNFSTLTTNDGITRNLDNSITLASVGASSWADVKVAYFIMDAAANGGMGGAWASGPATAIGAQINTYAYWGGFQPAAGSMIDGYRSVAGSNTSYTMAQSNTLSYWTNMNVSGASIGTMGGYLKGNGEVGLGALSTTGGYVDQVLYYYGADPDSGANGYKVASIRTSANGTVLNAPAVPIPAAAYLFGTGLMGLAGIRRKMAA